MSVSRREVLALGALGVAGAAVTQLPLSDRAVRAEALSELPPALMPRPYAQPFRRPPVLARRTLPGPDYRVVERQASAQVLAAGAPPTLVLGYEGAFPGPTVSVDRGEPLVFRVRNRLPAVHPTLGYPLDTSVHLHGSASLPQYDGYASDLTPPGFFKDYRWPNDQPARTLWYHDHAVHRTGQNVYSGLAAQYHLHDEQERALLPQGEYDVPLTVSDALFGADGNLVYDDTGHSGLWGDVVLVNGVPWPVMQVERRIYRFRVLNASIARSYRFALSSGRPVTVVATDGGLMPVARPVTSWRQANAERYEVLVDFRDYPVGSRVRLVNRSNPKNVDFPGTAEVMAFDVVADHVPAPGDTDPRWNTLPTTLVDSEVMRLSAKDAVRRRTMRFERKNGLWTINGTTWDDVVASGFRQVLADPGLGDVEVWTLQNNAGGWFHPVHIHLVDFRILSRNGRPPFDYEQGPKDVAYVGPNETVEVVMRFGPHRGKYMIHCHNLPHEDHDMMGQFSVGLAPGAVDDNDPIAADPCRLDDLPEES